MMKKKEEENEGIGRKKWRNNKGERKGMIREKEEEYEGI